MKQSSKDHWKEFLARQDASQKLVDEVRGAINAIPVTSECYELLVDWDGTLRSSYGSEGLFSSKDKAENFLTDLKKSGNMLGGGKIVKRIIR